MKLIERFAKAHVESGETALMANTAPQAYAYAEYYRLLSNISDAIQFKDELKAAVDPIDIMAHALYFHAETNAELELTTNLVEVKARLLEVLESEVIPQRYDDYYDQVVELAEDVIKKHGEAILLAEKILSANPYDKEILDWYAKLNTIFSLNSLEDARRLAKNNELEELRNPERRPFQRGQLERLKNQSNAAVANYKKDLAMLLANMPI